MSNTVPQKPVLIHYGCGYTTGPSWRNYDASATLLFERYTPIGWIWTKNAQRFPKAVRYGNIAKGPLCAAGTADAVFASHVLEHMPLGDMRRALRNTHAMLKPGGVFRLIIPDLRWRARAYLERATREEPLASEWFIDELKMGQASAAEGIVDRLRGMLGRSAHVWMYDAAGMVRELQAVGFQAIRRCEYGDSDCAFFAEVEDRGRFIDVNTQEKEVSIECRK